MQKYFLIIAVFFLCLTGKGQTGFYDKLSAAALELTKQKVQYDPAYFKMKYPGGDVPANKGVCTDVIIRAYRKMGIDLQKEVHEDIKANFSKYPNTWGLKKPDTNIDHRRVPNLMVFFTRKGKDKLISTEAADYIPGDIVCWNLGGEITHIGFVVNKKSDDKQRYLIVHNIGGGQELADCLFSYKIIGHYRYEKKVP
ncbi:MAG: DUF1287 domain-containing protein [Bacteroidota bacterium]